jgi:hypothetical protein
MSITLIKLHTIPNTLNPAVPRKEFPNRVVAWLNMDTFRFEPQGLTTTWAEFIAFLQPFTLGAVRRPKEFVQLLKEIQDFKGDFFHHKPLSKKTKTAFG